MSSINNIYVFKCDTCHRVVERLIDGKHPDPVRCVITNRCRGLLSLIETRTGKPRLTPPIVGVDDRIPRGTIPDQAVKTPDIPQASLATFIGGSGLVLASLERKVNVTAKFSVVDSNGDDFILESRPATFFNPVSSVITAVCYEVTPTVLEYRHYMFSYHGIAALVQGQDDTPERNLLRFTSTSSLRVYANGVELVEGVDYDRTIDDQLTLTPQINEANIIVDVYVYKSIVTEFNEDTATRLDFVALITTTLAGLTARNQCSWGNVSSVKMADEITRLPLFASSLASLKVNKSYGVQRFEASSSGETRVLKPENLTFLLSRPPYSFNDKRTSRFLSGDKLINNGVISFRIHEATGVLEPTVDETYITQVFKPLSISRYVINPLLTNPAATETTPHKRTITTPRKYVIGPS